MELIIAELFLDSSVWFHRTRLFSLNFMSDRSSSLGAMAWATEFSNEF